MKFIEKIKINFEILALILFEKNKFQFTRCNFSNVEVHTCNSLSVMFDIARKTGRISHCANTMSQQSFNLVHTELFSFFLSFKSLQYYLWLDCTANSFHTYLINMDSLCLTAFNSKRTYLVFFLLRLQVFSMRRLKWI